MVPNIRMIIDLNIRHYRDLLKSEADPAKRRTITNRLAEEKIKLAGPVSKNPRSFGEPLAPMGRGINNSSRVEACNPPFCPRTRNDERVHSPSR